MWPAGAFPWIIQDTRIKAPDTCCLPPAAAIHCIPFVSGCLPQHASLKALETACVSDPTASIDPLRRAAAWARLSPAVVTATGPDAVRFVDNFTTAAVSTLAIGSGTETFFTDVRGWVLALATVLRTEDGLVILAAPGLAAMLRDHLERYHIREAVELADATASLTTLLVAGPEAAEAVRRGLGTDALPESGFDHRCLELDAAAVRIVRVTGQGADGFWLQTEPGAGDGLVARLTAAGLPQAEPDTLESLRIEACYPLPAEILDKTLPQELGRDARAISFTKGCYLGQETVARLDAMGHVNRRLALVAIEAGEPPELPAMLELEGRPVATLTSICRSPVLGCPVGLGLVQTRGLAGDRLQLGGASARVVTVAGAAEQAPSTPAPEGHS